MAKNVSIGVGQTDDNGFPALVVKVISSTRLAINRGARDRIKLGQRYLVYSLTDEELEDPRTGETLGKLEIPKGVGIVIHVQDRLSIIESEKKSRTRRTVTRPHGRLSIFIEPQETIEEAEEIQPFRDPWVGDFVKPV